MGSHGPVFVPQKFLDAGAKPMVPYFKKFDFFSVLHALVQ